MKKITLALACIFCISTSFVLSEETSPKRIIFTDIAGDMLHAGHMEFFKKARAYGDYFIVGILADDVIEGYKRRPVLTLEERVKMLEACKYIDEVVINPPLPMPEDLIKEMGITYIVRGDDFNPELLEAQYGPAMKMGILRTVPYTKGISTTDIIRRITSRYDEGEFGGPGCKCKK